MEPSRLMEANNLDFYVGLFAEDPRSSSPLGELMTHMVAIDAFSQALTNPLLSEPVYSRGESVFGEPGWNLIKDKGAHTLKAMLERQEGYLDEYVGMDIQPKKKAR